MVFCNHQNDATLADPNFYNDANDAPDGLRNIVDGRWGAATIEQASWDGRVGNFTAKCNRFMGAWCAKAMGGEGSNQYTNIEGGSNLIYECLINSELAKMENLNLAWMRLCWNRMNEVIRDPMVGPLQTATLRTWLDRSQPISKGLTSNSIFESCRESCWVRGPREHQEHHLRHACPNERQIPMHLSTCAPNIQSGDTS